MRYLECSTCRHVLPLTEEYFPRRWAAEGRGELRSQCRECFNRRLGAWRQGRRPEWLAHPEEESTVPYTTRAGRCPPELLDDRIELYANRALNHVPLTRPWGALHGGRHMNRPGIGAQVIVVAPENGRLHGAVAVVRELREWGAVLSCECASSGEFRALWCEMVHPEEWLVGHGGRGEPAPPPPPPSQPVASVNGKAHRNGTPAKPSGAGYTGNSCGNCGGVRMVRTGPCETCQECGQSSGGCS